MCQKSAFVVKSYGEAYVLATASSCHNTAFSTPFFSSMPHGSLSLVMIVPREHEVLIVPSSFLPWRVHVEWSCIRCYTHRQVTDSYFCKWEQICLTFVYSILSFFCCTRAWTQGLHLEPLHQSFYVMDFFKIGFRGLFAQAGFEHNPPDLCLL
jgi:hypothetical protein